MRKLGAALGLAACAALPGVGFASEQEGWQFELTPYLWAFGVDGDLYAGAKGKRASTRSFSDITENMTGGGSILFAGSYNRIVFMVQYDFAQFDADADDFNDRLDEEFG